AASLYAGLSFMSGAEPDQNSPPKSRDVVLAGEGVSSRTTAFRDIAPVCGLEAIAEDTARANPNWRLASLHMVDLDSDGHLDVFLSGYGSGRSVAALNDGKGHFRPAPLAPGVDLKDRGIQLVCDLSGSGRPDFTTLTPGGMTEWWVNKSQPGQLQF